MVGVAGLMVSSCQRETALNVPICCAKEKAAPAGVADLLAANSSIYQLPGIWTDHHNHRLVLDELKGKVQVMAMVFTHCGYACPRIVQDMLAIQRSLPPAAKNEVGFVLVSFDSERDDAAQLARYAEGQGLDAHWTLLHGNTTQVRELSLLLSVRYQRLADSNYAHSNAIFVLDRQGAISGTIAGLEPRTDSAIRIIDRLTGR